jgi:arylsulfatase A-like enzyme
VLTQEAIQWIEAHRAEPFFLYLTHPMPHGPVAASERFRGKSDAGLYGDSVEEIDWSTGRIIETLKRLDLEKNTLVIYTSDNGADPRADWGVRAPFFGSNKPLRGKKQEGWEGGLRVPCVAWWPGRIPAGTVCDQVATVMDFLPTFAALAGAKVPDDRVIDGHDIRPLLFGEDDAQSPYDAFIYHVRFGKVAGIRMGDWKLLVDVDALTFRHKGPSLYNLKQDVAERHNIAAKHPEIVEKLKARLDAFRRELRETTRPVGKE